MTIYIDLIFLLNFLGDYLCLWLTSTVYRPISLRRKIAAAATGAIFGTALSLAELILPYQTVAKLTGSFLVALCAYMPLGIHELLRASAVFALCSMLLSGGAMLASTADGLWRTVLTLFGCACLLVCALATVKSRIYSRYLSAELCFMGKKLRLSGFYDSGNRLTVGDRAKSVIIADERVLKRLISPDATAANISEWADCCRIVTVNFTGAAGGVMLGITLDYAKIDGRRYDEVVLAISEKHLSDSLVLHSTMV